ALYLRTLEDLKTSVIAQMGGTAEDGIRIAFAAYRNGLAQRVMWLMQADLPQPKGRLPIFEQIVERLHAVRKEAGAAADIEDTRKLVHLITIAAFGDAIIGPHLRRGSDEETQRTRFEAWFGELVRHHIQTEATKGQRRR